MVKKMDIYRPDRDVQSFFIIYKCIIIVIVYKYTVVLNAVETWSERYKCVHMGELNIRLDIHTDNSHVLSFLLFRQIQIKGT